MCIHVRNIFMLLKVLPRLFTWYSKYSKMFEILLQFKIAVIFDRFTRRCVAMMHWERPLGVPIRSTYRVTPIYCQMPSSTFLRALGFHTRVMWFTALLNVYSVQVPSFPVALRKRPWPSVNPRLGVRMLSSPFLSLSLPFSPEPACVDSRDFSQWLLCSSLEAR